MLGRRVAGAAAPVAFGFDRDRIAQRLLLGDEIGQFGGMRLDRGRRDDDVVGSRRGRGRRGRYASWRKLAAA